VLAVSSVHSAPARQTTLDDLGTPLIDTTFVVVDLETTGLNPLTDRITEIGAVRIRGGEQLGEFSTFVHPERPIPAAITAITGITDAMVRGAPRIGDVIELFRTFLGDAVLVAHNAPFDVGFLRAALQRHGNQQFAPVVVDTARLARRLLKHEVRNVRLGTLARHLRARVEPNHRALTDARATVDVLHGLLERAGPLGATTLEDLRELTRSRSDRRFRRIALVRDAPRACGVYQFLGHDGEVLYVGKATDLRARLRSYFGQDTRRGMDQLIRETVRVSWVVTPTVLDAEIRELRAIQTHQPRFNRRSTRPTPAVYVALTDEPFPRLAVVTQPRERHRRTIGPLSSRRQAERVVSALEAASGIRPCRMRLRRAQDHAPCILLALGRCGAPCNGSQTSAEYGAVVAQLEAMLDDPSDLLGALRQRMHDLAAQQRFEAAAQARAELHAVARAFDRQRRVAQLREVDRLVIAWPRETHHDVVLLDRGRYVASARVDAGQASDVTRVQWPLALDDERAIEGDPVAETSLLLAALDRPGSQLVDVDGVFASTIAAGAELAATVAESRRVNRSLQTNHYAREGDLGRRSPRQRQATALGDH
jgi:DNA polymerase III subunit epsilon